MQSNVRSATLSPRMCLLIVLAGVDPAFPVVVAGNRDEQRARPSAPPGLFVGLNRRMLSPRDRRAGGTWLAVSDRGMVAGLTNLAGVPRRAGARSRGELPHLALDQADVGAAVEAVRTAAERTVFDGFQLVVSDGLHTRVLVHRDGRIEEHDIAGGSVVISNEHRIGELGLPGLDAACAEGLSVEDRFAALAVLLLDTGASSGHRVLKRGGDYGTVSSSLIAVPRGDIRGLRWRFAPGQPDEVPYREYGNLARRLVEV